MAYRHTNSRGITYYLNAKELTLAGGSRHTVFYFSQDERPETAADLPAEGRIQESPLNGLLVVKRAGGSAPPSAAAPDPDLEVALAVGPEELSVSLLDEGQAQDVAAQDEIEYRLTPTYLASLFNSQDCLERLEYLVRSNARESDLQECLEECPELVRIFGHRDAVPQVVLEVSDAGRELVPDFVLRPVAHDLCDLLELKRPSMPLVAGQGRRSRSGHLLAKAINQLYDYAEALEDIHIRGRVAERYGLNFFRPRLYLIAGRASSFDEIQLRRAVHPDYRVEVVSWDEVIARARDRQKPKKHESAD